MSRLKHPHVVIVGGGFAGLYAARGLAGASVRVTLVDKRNYHLFRPMLYQVATGLLSADEIAPPLRSILSRQPNVDVLMSEVIGVDKEKKLVQLQQGAVPFDFLVLATGIQYNYFGHDEFKQWSAGVLASPAARWLATPADRAGRVKVNPDLSIPGYPNIFAIGDTALVIAPSRNLIGLKNGTVQPMPGLAQPAIQEGKYVANLIGRRVEGQSPPEPFWYWDKGDLAIVGRTFAVADLRFLRFSGLARWCSQMLPLRIGVSGDRRQYRRAA